MQSAAASRFPASSPSMEKSHDIVVEAVRTEKELLALKDEWNDLLKRSDSNLLFLAHEWVTCWWNHFGRARHLVERSELFVLALRRQGRLCGLAPLVIEVERVFGMPVRILRFLGHGASDYSDFILAEDKDTVLQSVTEYLSARSAAWDIIDLREFYGESSNLRWVDNFHTAYVLDSIKHYIQSTGDRRHFNRMENGYKYWKRNFFKT